MKRRDLLKTGLVTLGAGTIALTGCAKKDNSSSDDILPKQTSGYEFSCPLPFDYKTIDEMAEFNSTIKKSKIAILHNNIPAPLVNKYNRWIHISRGKENPSIKSLEDFGKYVKYASDKGFDFSYLMNSPKSFTEKEYLTFKDDFLKLLDYLKKIEVKNIKVGNNQIIDLINQHAPGEFNLQVSTCFELHNISQYKNLFEMYSNIDFIDISHSENQNFALFKSLKKLYSDKKIEIVINEENCIKKCPARLIHSEEPDFCRFDCRKLSGKMGLLHYFVKSGSIYPWDMEYYSAMGINNFKFMPKPQSRSDYRDLDPIKKLLSIIENGYENYTIKDMYDANWFPPFIVQEKTKNIKLSEIAPLFPNMKYFIKYGNKCATRCETECNYCLECAKKIEKVLSLG